ncbi:MAG: LD-carboxypeptidase [Bacteroidales bacterium]|nr:LD-carboxypeptidase [Bacteroidales bacterium]
MITPAPLKTGDKVGITATARKVKPEELLSAINIIKSWGLEVRLSPSLYEEDNQFAGNDKVRASDFQAMLKDEDIKAIFCARGGYGTVRILEHIDFSALKTHPKWIVGFSDTTVLHSHIHQNAGVKTLHAPMPLTFANSPEGINALTTLHLTLFGLKPDYSVNPHPLNRIGTTQGTLVGGNLSVLYSLIGSESDLDTNNKILFIEDLDEYLYHIDRMMVSFKRSGKLSKLKGLIVGSMSDMHDNAIPFGKNAFEIISDAVSTYDYPVCFGFPAGHQDLNLPLIMGNEIRLIVEANKAYLSFIEPD